MSRKRTPGSGKSGISRKWLMTSLVRDSGTDSEWATGAVICASSSSLAEPPRRGGGRE